MAYQYQNQQPYPAANPYSDWLTRVGAYLIDIAPVIAVWVVFWILAAVIGSVGFAILLYLLAAVGSIAYTAWNRWVLGGQGQSIGKRQLNIKLISEDTGQPIGSVNAFLRDLCHVIDGLICYIGYLFPLWDAKRQTLADKMMRTVVIPA